MGDERRGAWKLDVWFLDQTGYDAHANYAERIRRQLTAETREAILAIKEAYWRRPEYRDRVTSEMIYRAVLDNRVRSVEEFKRSLSG